MFCFCCQNNDTASKTIIIMDGGVDFAGGRALGEQGAHTVDLSQSSIRNQTRLGLWDSA